MRLETTIAGKKYKMGYTTGACAAAAAQAAARLLVLQEQVNQVTIDLPIGKELTIPISHLELGDNYALATVLKNGGDDPDITNGMEITATVRFHSGNSIFITGGIGIGTVTQKGLKVAVGEKAINPEPRKMIRHEVEKIQKNGLSVVISAPEGEERAKKTLNERLGIKGGISIIGTTGLVRPMSEEAWKDSLFQELEMKQKQGLKKICFVFGNYGEEFAKKQLSIPFSEIIIMSNFVGYMLESAVNLGFSEVLLVGHAGKLVKVACGNFHTHSKVSDGRIETICTFAALSGANQEIIKSIYSCTTTQAAFEILQQNHLKEVYQKIANRAETRCLERVYQKIPIGCVLFGEDVLAKGETAEKLLKNWNCSTQKKEDK